MHQNECLGELRAKVNPEQHNGRSLQLREIVGDVQKLHAHPGNAGALFQVASQFNLLEMVSENVTPERGVGIYEHDRTQGPACAIAAGAGTIYRNYFAEVDGYTGQSADHQIDCLADMGRALGNENNRLWTMQNGYALATREGLLEITEHLQKCDEARRDALRCALRIGVHWNTEVTINGSVDHTVTQAYCSALPVAYVSDIDSSLWSEFARLVLEAAYEATFCAAVLNAQNTGNNRVFLTQIGGGVFGNDKDWIIGAIRRALVIHKDSGLDVGIVSYGSSKDHVKQLIDDLNLR